MRTTQNYITLIFALIVIGLILYILIRAFFSVFPKYKQYHLYVFVFCFIGILGIPLGIFFGDGTFGGIFQLHYTIGAFLLGIFFLSSFIFVPSYIIAKIRKKSFAGWEKGIIAVLCLGLNAHALYAGFVPHIQEYSIKIDKNHGWNGKKIVLISDMHYGFIHGKIEANYLVKKINAIQPDIVLIPGDFFDGPTMDFREITDIFAGINAPTFYVNGNHEEYRNTQHILDAIETSDMIILNDETIAVDSGMNISGVTYHINKTEAGLTSTLDAITPTTSDTINILMRHEPTLHTVIEPYGYDLVVSGHTHRGQMWPFSLLTESIYGKYVHGLNQDGNMYSFTTSGVGNW